MIFAERVFSRTIHNSVPLKHTIVLISGLKYIYQMTKGVTNELRLDIEKSTGEKGYAVYQTFSLSGPSDYKLNIRKYSGTAGICLL